MLIGAAGALCAQDGVIALPTSPRPTPPPASAPKASDELSSGRPATAATQPLAPAGMQEGVAPPVDPTTFRVGPEDVLEIQVWREPQASGQVVVRPDGMVTVALVGEVEVGGKTLQEITKILTDKYSEVMNDPLIMVQPRAIRSSKYFVAGAVLKPGPYPLVVETTVLDAIIMAGGVQEFANTKKIRIQHKNKTQDFFNYNDVTKGKKLEQNIVLQNGDYIFVNQ